MFKAKCGICGSELITAFLPNGLRIAICPNVKGRTVKIGLTTKQIEIWCDMQPTSEKTVRFRPIDKTQQKAWEEYTKNKGLRETFNRIVSNRYYEILKTATYDIIPENQLLEQTNLALLMELPLLQLPKLFNSAIKLSRAMGLNPTKGIEAISKGIGRRSWMILDNIGIKVKRGLKGEQWTKEAIKQALTKASELPDPTKEEMEKLIKERNELDGLIELGKKLVSEEK